MRFAGRPPAVMPPSITSSWPVMRAFATELLKPMDEQLS